MTTAPLVQGRTRTTVSPAKQELPGKPPRLHVGAVISIESFGGTVLASIAMGLARDVTGTVPMCTSARLAILDGPISELELEPSLD